MDLITISSLILVKAQPLLSILGLTGAIASVQLTVILAIALISIITIISTLSLMVYAWKKIIQKKAKLDSEDKEVEDPDLQEKASAKEESSDEEVLDEAFDFEQNSNEEILDAESSAKEENSDKEVLNEAFDFEQNSNKEAPPKLEAPIVSTQKHSNIEELQARIQAEPVLFGYKPEPKIIGKYYDSLETIVAIHTYKDLCLHIEKTILEPKTYSIEYKIENNNLIAYLHSPNNITKINIDNMFLELNGRFDAVLKLLTQWNIGCKNIAVILKHLSMLDDSIQTSRAPQWNDYEFGFSRYTNKFWENSVPCRLLNCLVWSKPSEAHIYHETSPHNISLLIIMAIALTKYLSMIKEGPYRSEQILQRTEGDFCTYKVGDVIDCKFFRPFSQIHPADTGTCIAENFKENPNFLVLKNYTGGLLTGGIHECEKEVVITTDVLITVTEITENCTERRDKDNRNPPYRTIEMSATTKPPIADEYLVNPPETTLSNFLDKTVAKHFTNTSVLSTILEYAGLPSDASNNKSGNKKKKPSQ